MPNATLHFLLADRVLAHWRRAPREAPFTPEDPTAGNAFLHGALGPDMGYYPGGDALYSEVAHLDRSGTLARNLLRAAETDQERAFAWGWVTHVLADVAVHPLVDRACGELVLGDCTRPLGASQAPGAHVRVELGLDAVYVTRDRRLQQMRLRPGFTRAGLGFLAAAYRATYGIEADTVRLHASHLAVARLQPRLLALTRIAAAGFDAGAPLGILRRPLGIAARKIGNGSLVFGFLTPARPAPWLLEAVDAVVDEFVDRFRGHYETALEDLPDYNLEDGTVQAAPSGAGRAQSALDTLRGRTPAIGASTRVTRAA